VLRAGEDAVVILDRTPFYAESGGQVGDTGQLAAPNATFDVRDTLKLAGQFHGHVGTFQAGQIEVGGAPPGSVDAQRLHSRR
jgi:alanyl-tRNA synthetase